MKVKLLYFALVREATGLTEEWIELPAEVATLADLLHWQRGRGDNFAIAFSEERRIRGAIDQQHAPPETPLAGAREIAFFPPVTGG